jgi:predicted DsbA family dithiol-disulfide isomerase
MKIEIWSDVMCPFCYIGKRHFEKALVGLPAKEHIEIEWKSFQLNPDMTSEPGVKIHQYLSRVKGVSIQQAESMNQHVTAMAAESGLQYDMDKVVIGNSHDAHRIIQLAKTKNLGDQAEEFFFKSYFCEGKDIADHAFLQSAGEAIGLSSSEVKEVLTTDAFSDAVKNDIQEAAQLGIQGVPFFVIDRKYGISGAQPVEVFMNTLEKAQSQITQ